MSDEMPIPELECSTITTWLTELGGLDYLFSQAAHSI